MAGLFDDLIPAQAVPPQAAAPSSPFADLIPPAQAPVPLPTPRPPQQSALDKVLGINGPRYQLFPERLARGLISGTTEAASLPGQVVQEATTPKTTISDSDVSALSVPAVMNFAAGASPMSAAARSGEAAIPGTANNLVRQQVAPPTTEQLAKAGAADIDAAAKSDLRVSGSGVGNWSQGLQQRLLADGIHPIDAPATFAKLQEAQNAPPGAFATAANLISLRRSLGKTAQNFNPAAAADQLAASRAIKALDEYLPNVAPQDVLAGTPAATADLLKRGNANYAAAMRSNDLTGVLDRANTGILERAEARAQSANSGRNLDNTIRSKIASLLEKPKEVSGYNDAEIGALNDVLEGGTARNTARYIGNLLGGGGGIGQSLVAGAGGAGAGAALGGPVGAAIGAAVPTAVGAAAKTVANELARRSLGKADELIRSNSPLYQEMLQSAPLVPSSIAGRAAVARALLLSALDSNRQ